MESHEYEMHHQDLRYRGIVRQDGQVQVYMQNHCIDSSKEMEFDSKKDTDTSVNLFCAGLLSGILHGICSFMKKEGNPLEDVEAKARVILDHPLSYLGVKGYEESPRISKITIDLYFYSFLEEEETIERCKEALKKNILYQSLSPAVEIDLHYHSSL